MAAKPKLPVLDLLVDPLSQCLTKESARRVINMKSDKRLQAAVNQLAEKCNEGTLTPNEKAQYEAYVSFGTFIALLKSKARRMVEESAGD